MNPRVWFKSISLENVRSFGTKQTIYFTEDGTENGKAARWNVILGDNGTGKTTVLKGLALTVDAKFGGNKLAYSDDNLASLVRWGEGYDVRINASTEQVEGDQMALKVISFASADFSEAMTFSSKFSNKLVVLPVTHDVDDEPVNRFSPDDKKLYLHAYGAARRISEGDIPEDKNVYHSLFSENISLTNAEKWLVQSEYVSLKEHRFRNRYEKVLGLLKKLFRDEVDDIYINTSTGVPKVFFKTHYGDVRLHELSLGYKTLIAWMVDFASGLFDEYPDSPDPLAEPAACLVDEIDLHLHPKFQRNIIQFLTETFPNTQFIVTAHSPLIVQSAEDANIILLKREGNETHVAGGIDVHSWRIDQILSSDLFGGIGGRAPQIEERIARRRTLLRKDARTPEEEQELNDLDRELNDLPVMETREALKAIDIISKAVISEG